MGDARLAQIPVEAYRMTLKNNPLDKNSPFPWKLEQTNGLRVTDKDGTNIAEILWPLGHAKGKKGPERDALPLANARIFVASPDMIEALRHVYAHLALGMSTRQEVLEVVEEAYKKAMGRGFSTPCTDGVVGR